MISVQISSTLEMEMLTTFLCKFKNVAISSDMKLTSEPESRNTRKYFDFPCGFNKSTIAVANSPRFLNSFRPRKVNSL